MGSDETEKPDAASEQRSADVPAQPHTPARHAEKPVLPTVSRDETDVGWGDEPGERDADWYRRERPPHHE